jgi:hypothetical protein
MTKASWFAGTGQNIPRRNFKMLHNQPQDRDYLIDSLDDVEAVIDGLSFNVQDHNWLVYCALGGHEHYALPEVDTETAFNLPEFYHEAA